MQNFDLESARKYIILIIISACFVLLVWHAFEYLPKEETELKNITEQETVDENYIQDPSSSDSEEQENSVDNDESESNDESIESEKVVDQQEINKNTDKFTLLENIPEGEQISSNEQSAENFAQVFDKACELKTKGEFAEAIKEYMSALVLAKTDEERARCYEETAYIYAKSHKYGSALSAAEKAFNSYPTTSRELLLARLYYKSGNQEKANVRMNNILNRDFAQDR